ncbi:hypothetical protein [Halarcobacter anaerophilus]|uniref:hypothetical protein n=1 Tax=Halarcobacter anaerophilus TaxID=877500 RepID=UPI0005C7F65D|nr:hypothetical protein [Halarcobacter anaerophilus]
MTKAEIYSKILEVSEKSYYRWKSKDHTILLDLIEKYFLDQELEEFLETEKIRKLELIKGFTADELEDLLFSRNSNSDEQLIDFVEHNIDLDKVKTFFSLRVEIKDFLYFFQKINEEKPDLKLENAKEFILYKIQNDFYNPTIFGIFKTAVKHHQKSLYQLIQDKYSNVEVYVLLKKNIKLK